MEVEGQAGGRIDSASVEDSPGGQPTDNSQWREQGLVLPPSHLPNHSPTSPSSQLLDCCVDGMMFGALKPCPECRGQLVIGNYSYHCTGNISSWTKCVYSTVEPSRGVWTVTDDLREEASCL